MATRQVTNSNAETLTRGRVAKLASPVVLSTPVLKIATFHSSSLGSLVASLPALMALRDSFPGARIESFARAPLLPLLEHFSGVDGVHARPGGGISSQAALMARLRGADFDLALSFSQGSNALLLMWATGAPVRAGFVPSRMDALLTHKTPKSTLATAHAPGLSAGDALELVRGIGATPRGERARDFLRLSPDVTAKTRALVAKSGIEGPFLIISPEARRGEVRRGEARRGEVRRGEVRRDEARPSDSRPSDSWPSDSQQSDGARKRVEAGVSPAAIGELAGRFPLVVVGLKPKAALLHAVGETAHPVVDVGGQTDVLTLAALCEMSRGAFGVGHGVLQLAKLFDRPIASPREGDAMRALQIFGF